MTITARLHRAHGALTTLTDGHHAWHADVGRDLGSEDAAPGPHELLDSALAACTALTLDQYLRRRPMAGVTGVVVKIEHVEDKGADGRVNYKLTRTITVEGEASDEDRARLQAIAEKCPIHKVLTGEIAIETALG